MVRAAGRERGNWSAVNGSGWSVTACAAFLIFLAGCGGGGGAGEGETEQTPVTPGASTAVYAEPTPAGATCPHGGWRVHVGIDENANGTLDEAERDEFYDICNGAPGETGLVLSTPEGVGTNCPSGGLKIQTGFDDDGDTVLEPEEIDDTSYACNGLNQQALVDVNAPGSWLAVTGQPNEATACLGRGGSQYIAFLGVNPGTTFDEGTDTLIDYGYSCTGLPGLDTLIAMTTLAQGQGGCVQGGHLIESGHDDDRDSVFDKPGEVDNTYTICNGLIGINQGLPGAPLTIAKVTPNSFGVPFLGTVAANGSSFYHFQTFTDGTPADYSGRWQVVLLGTESRFDYETHSTSAFSDGTPFVPPQGCAWGVYATGMACTTQNAGEGQNVYFKLDEVFSVPNQFEAWITYGANEGTWGAAAPFAGVSTPIDTGASRTHNGSIGGWPFSGDQDQNSGGSFYKFEPGLTGPYSVRIQNLRSIPAAPGILGMGMTLVSESSNEWSGWIDGCRQENQGIWGRDLPWSCLFNIPTAGGAKYVLRVTQNAYAHSGGMMDIVIAQGDTLTQLLTPVATNSANLTTPPFASGALNAGLYEDGEDKRLYRVRTSTNTAVTIVVRQENDEWGFVSWELFDGFDALKNGSPIQDCWDGICSTPVLTSGQDYYLRIWYWDSPLEAIAYNRHFNEGTSGAPVALGTSVTDRPSTVASGSPASSWYSIGTTSAVPYTITFTNSVDWNRTVMDTFYPSFWEADGVTPAYVECNFVFPDQFGLQGTNRCFLDAAASATYKLEMRNFRAARVFQLSVQPSPVLTLGVQANPSFEALDKQLFVFNTNGTDTLYDVSVDVSIGSFWAISTDVHDFNNTVCSGLGNQSVYTCSLNIDQRYYLFVTNPAHFPLGGFVLVEPTP